MRVKKKKKTKTIDTGFAIISETLFVRADDLIICTRAAVDKNRRYVRSVVLRTREPALSQSVSTGMYPLNLVRIIGNGFGEFCVLDNE